MSVEAEIRAPERLEDGGEHGEDDEHAGREELDVVDVARQLHVGAQAQPQGEEHDDRLDQRRQHFGPPELKEDVAVSLPDAVRAPPGQGDAEQRELPIAAAAGRGGAVSVAIEGPWRPSLNASHSTPSFDQDPPGQGQEDVFQVGAAVLDAVRILDPALHGLGLIEGEVVDVGHVLDLLQAGAGSEGGL